MTQRSRRVVVTGAGGLIGRTIAPLLPPGWDLLRTDLRAGDSVAALDVTDLDACRADLQETTRRLDYRPTDGAW